MLWFWWHKTSWSNDFNVQRMLTVFVTTTLVVLRSLCLNIQQECCILLARKTFYTCGCAALGWGFFKGCAVHRMYSLTKILPYTVCVYQASILGCCHSQSACEWRRSTDTVTPSNRNIISRLLEQFILGWKYAWCFQLYTSIYLLQQRYETNITYLSKFNLFTTVRSYLPIVSTASQPGLVDRPPGPTSLPDLQQLPPIGVCCINSVG